MKEFFNSEQFLLIFIGVASIAYACSWIYKILKSPKPYHIWQYIYISLALVAIVCGISTFFTKCTLNCLCGFYAGVSELINLHHDYLEDKKRGARIVYRTIYYANGLGLGLSFIIPSLFFILNLYLD